MEANIQDWFKAFFATSDDESAHAKYTTFFAPHAKLIMGSKTAVGQEGRCRFYLVALWFSL
jgi:hypothetical protein